MNEVLTSKLEDFGYLERVKLEKILHLWNTEGLPPTFWEEDVKFFLNKDSGYVFLTNCEYQTLVVHRNKLELFYSCPECGHEGFLEDMDHNSNNEECQNYFKEIKGGNYE